MKKNHLTIVLLVALVIGACEIPGMVAVPLAPTQIPPEAIYTFAAITLQAQLTLNAPFVIPPSNTAPPTNPPPTETPTNTLVPTNTPVTASPTLEPTLTLAFTSTSTLPQISATMDTNCRSGPGPQYTRVGYLLVGQVSEVYGRNSSGTWWYIRNPARTNAFCWVWGASTSVGGATTVSLPVMTAPPPPATTTPGGVAISVVFSNVHKCSGDKHVILRVKNTGGKALESMSIKTKDVTTDTMLSGATSSDSPFLDSSNDCPSGDDTLDAGDTGYVANNIAGAVSGHEARTTVTLCTKEGLAGNCETVQVKYTIP